MKVFEYKIHQADSIDKMRKAFLHPRCPFSSMPTHVQQVCKVLRKDISYTLAGHDQHNNAFSVSVVSWSSVPNITQGTYLPAVRLIFSGFDMNSQLQDSMLPGWTRRSVQMKPRSPGITTMITNTYFYYVADISGER